MQRHENDTWAHAGKGFKNKFDLEEGEKAGFRFCGLFGYLLEWNDAVHLLAARQKHYAFALEVRLDETP